MRTTKYILHGGDTSQRNRGNDAFFREMTSGLHGRVKILLNYFACEGRDMEKLAAQDKQRLLRCSKNKNLEFQVAETGAFENQLRWADVMYLRGGSTATLMKKLKIFKSVLKLFDGKVIAGSSAGAYAISKYYWGNNAKALGRGLGALEIKCYCHCKPNDTRIIKTLLEYKEELPMVLLPEHEMLVINV
jgi:hypothetical protein